MALRPATRAQEALEASREGFAELGVKLMPFSAATREGLDKILLALEAVLKKSDPKRVTSDKLVLGARPQDLHDTAGSGSRDDEIGRAHV